MKIEYALRVKGLKNDQPSMRQIRAAVSELVWQKVEADKGRVEAADFVVEISDHPEWLDGALTAARQRANRCQVLLGKTVRTVVWNLKERDFSNEDIAKVLDLKESSV